VDYPRGRLGGMTGRARWWNCDDKRARVRRSPCSE